MSATATLATPPPPVLTPRAFRARVAVLAAAAGLAVTAAALVRPVSQDPAYHAFADARTILGVPSFLNVASNAVFLIAGAWGLIVVGRRPLSDDGPLRRPWERGAFLVLFAGVALTAIGSARYHAAPSNATLVWDRLPMTLAFMAFFAVTVAERVGLAAGRRLLPLLLAVGVASVWYWDATERAGAGDLRLYGLVQFLPMALIPLLLLLFPPAYTGTADVLAVLGWYVAAKAAEVLDAPIFAAGGIVSGHTVKHVLSGVAALWIVRMLKRRRPVRPLTG